MLKVLLGVTIGFVLFSNPEARQITADMLRTAGDVLAPATENKTLQERIQAFQSTNSCGPKGN